VRRTGNRSATADNSVPPNRCGRKPSAKVNEDPSAEPVRSKTSTASASCAITSPENEMTWAAKITRNSPTASTCR
jgi:hypothetical protein